MATEMSAQMQNYRRVNEEAVRAEADSAKSAADAKTAAEQAAAVRADLQRKQSQLQVQIAIVKSRYATLTPDQRTALAAPDPSRRYRSWPRRRPTRCRTSTRRRRGARTRTGGPHRLRRPCRSRPCRRPAVAAVKVRSPYRPR